MTGATSLALCRPPPSPKRSVAGRDSPVAALECKTNRLARKVAGQRGGTQNRAFLDGHQSQTPQTGHSHAGDHPEIHTGRSPAPWYHARRGIGAEAHPPSPEQAGHRQFHHRAKQMDGGSGFMAGEVYRPRSGRTHWVPSRSHCLSPRAVGYCRAPLG